MNKEDAMSWAFDQIYTLDQNPQGTLVHIDADKLQEVVSTVYDIGESNGQIKEAKWTTAHQSQLAG